MKRIVLACCLALCLVACGGGSASPSAPGPSDGLPSSLVLVRYDHNGDGQPDVLTLDATAQPYAIVEALEATPDGAGVDRTEAWRGQTVDPALSEALARHAASSFELGTETDLDVLLEGRLTPVTVIE